MDEHTFEAVAVVYNKLFQFLPVNDSNGDPQPADVTLSEGAKTEWIDFYNRHAVEQSEHGENLSAGWAKLEGAAARLALVVHCVRYTSGETIDPYECDAQSMEAGIELADWFGVEAERIYGAMRESDADRGRREVAEVVERIGGRARVRELMRHSKRFGSAAEWDEALADMPDAGLGKWESKVDTGPGHPTGSVFVLNQKTSGDTLTNDTFTDSPLETGDSVNCQPVNGVKCDFGDEVVPTPDDDPDGEAEVVAGRVRGEI